MSDADATSAGQMGEAPPPPSTGASPGREEPATPRVVVKERNRHVTRLHKPSSLEVLACERMRAEAALFLDAIDAYVHPGRCHSIARTKVEEALMWAIKGIVVPEWREKP